MPAKKASVKKPAAPKPSVKKPAAKKSAPKKAGASKTPEREPVKAERPPTPPPAWVDIGFKQIQGAVVEDEQGQWKGTSKWPCLVDGGGRSSVFFQYRSASMVDPWSKTDLEAERLRTILIGAMRYGKTYLLELHDTPGPMLTHIAEALEAVEPGLWEKIMSKRLLTEFRSLVRPDDGVAYDETNWVAVHEDFNVLFLQTTEQLDERLRGCALFRVLNPPS
eukprot:TRINITY_DN1595_c0_g5_i1.p1 TRINITY_DN1595_c0_g5~~TRINITY_DN1595_c0_g5_i1.p1  ORF type:complete len:221 (+),score=85.08 TRINITY_DN1595_c0_g5_i1:64-726(+)